MGKLNDFITYLKEQADNHCIYVWGAQGEGADVITETWIRNRETTVRNADRALAYWRKQVAAGFGKVLKAFDCSGLGVFFFLKNGIIDDDMTAQGIRGLCKVVTAAKAGDFVFRVDSDNHAYHIGYVIDDALTVIEAKGRDDGVCRTNDLKTGSGYWHEIRRPSWWGSETAWRPPTFVITKLLKFGMNDAEVIHITRNLKALGYTNRETSIFDDDIRNVVIRFQKAYNLFVDGVVGKETTEALGGIWDPNYIAPTAAPAPAAPAPDMPDDETITDEPEAPTEAPAASEEVVKPVKKKAKVVDYTDPNQKSAEISDGKGGVYIESGGAQRQQNKK